MASGDAAPGGEIVEPLLAGAVPAGPSGAISRAVSTCLLAEGISDADKLARHRRTQRRLLAALALASAFMVVEVAGGIYAGSLAIVTDAAHLLSDVAGFAVSAFAASAAARRSHHHFSYGYHRVEVLGALASILSVWVVTSILVWEAVQRVINPEPVNGKVMTVIAVGGVAVNLALFAILGGHGHAGHAHAHGHVHKGGGGLEAVEEGHGHGDSDDDDGGSSHGGSENGHHGHSHGACRDEEPNINVRGAVAHVLGDLIQSIGVVVAGALIWAHQGGDPRWALADPACTFLFAGLVLWTTAGVLRDVADVLMERAPRRHDVGDIWGALSSLEGVAEVHDLHVWSLTPGIPLLAAHVAVEPGADPAAVLRAVSRYCRRRLGIAHTTVQLMVADGGRCTCGATPPGSASSSQQSLAAAAGGAAARPG